MAPVAARMPQEIRDGIEFEPGVSFRDTKEKWNELFERRYLAWLIKRADGKGAAGEQFATFAKWYADNKAAGRTVGEIAPVIDDYGDAKTGAAATAEIRFETKQGADTHPQCLVFAWIEGARS